MARTYQPYNTRYGGNNRRARVLLNNGRSSSGKFQRSNINLEELRTGRYTQSGSVARVAGSRSAYGALRKVASYRGDYKNSRALLKSGQITARDRNENTDHATRLRALMRAFNVG